MSATAKTMSTKRSHGERLAKVLVIAGILVVWSGIACTAALELIAG
jgi:hypothetical protein